MALLRDAKAALKTDVKVIPVEALPGTGGRILAFGQVPPFCCESVLIKSIDSAESIARALDFFLTAPAGAPGSFTEEMWLSAVMDAEVRRVA